MDRPNRTDDAQAPRLDLEACSDFVRGVASPRVQAAFEQALEEGDVAAVQQVEWLREILSLARADADLELPSAALRGARSLHGLQAWPERSRFGLLAVNVLYDSRSQPQLAGTRNLHFTGYEMHFQCGAYFVDLSVDTEGRSDSRVVVGELLRSDVEPVPVPDAPVVFLEEGRVVAQSSTGAFGEFQAQVKSRGGLSCYFQPSDAESFRLDLGRSDTDPRRLSEGRGEDQ